MKEIGITLSFGVPLPSEGIPSKPHMIGCDILSSGFWESKFRIYAKIYLKLTFINRPEDTHYTHSTPPSYRHLKFTRIERALSSQAHTETCQQRVDMQNQSVYDFELNHAQKVAMAVRQTDQVNEFKTNGRLRCGELPRRSCVSASRTHTHTQADRQTADSSA